MERRISLVTLAVDDLDAAVAFHEALGWTVTDRNDDIAEFDVLGQGFAYYRRSHMARDMGVPAEELRPGGTVLSYNVRTADEVAPTLDAVREAGGEVLAEAHEVFWGGTVGFFRGPEGHLWEVAHNPHSPLAPDGSFRWDGYDDRGQPRPRPTP